MILLLQKYNLINRNKININIKTINTVIDIYNSNLYKFTNSPIGRIPKIKEDFNKISSKKFMSLEEYLNSIPLWNQIDKFLKDLPNDIKIYDYINMFFKNWNDIATRLNLTKYKKPIARIIFSSKMIYLYSKYKEKDEKVKVLNKHLNAKKDDNFYRLTPSLQSNVNSLFKLKKLNPDLKYKEIISLFIGEFEEEFIDKVNALKEEDINIDMLSELFS